MNTISKKVEDLVLGNRVDLKSCPFLNNHPIAESEYAVVTYIERAMPGCVVIGYEGIDHVGDQLGTSVQVRAPKDVPDPIVKVHPLGKPEEWEEWHISQNLTDRWGDLNHYDADNKPLDLLADDDGLLERLVNQMWGESTFVVRKDGKFGILFEVEFCSLESEEPEKENSPDWYATLKPHTEVVKALLEGMHPLAEKFPNVQFAVPDEEVIINDRPAAWAFVPDGLLNKEQRKELGNALLGL